jgi:uncharacterized membrane protein
MHRTCTRRAGTAHRQMLDARTGRETEPDRITSVIDAVFAIIFMLMLLLAFGLAGRQDYEDRYMHQTPADHAYLVSIGEVSE